MKHYCSFMYVVPESGGATLFLLASNPSSSPSGLVYGKGFRCERCISNRDHGANLLQYPHTDTGDAERLVRLYGPDIRFCGEMMKAGVISPALEL